jgi:hypothetical protein
MAVVNPLVRKLPLLRLREKPFMNVLPELAPLDCMDNRRRKECHLPLRARRRKILKELVGCQSAIFARITP